MKLLNNYYNFKNTIRFFLNIDNLNFSKTEKRLTSINEHLNLKQILCRTSPLNYKIKKSSNEYRILKIPVPLNFYVAYNAFCNLENFGEVYKFDSSHKRLKEDLNTGDFKSKEFNIQLNEDLINLCKYDYLLKLDIKSYYDNIYTHNIDFENKENYYTSMNQGNTNELIMGNYISLYFAEKYLAKKITKTIKDNIQNNKINCKFNYFSDDFYFFVNSEDIDTIKLIFQSSLEKYNLERNFNKEELYDYISYNDLNILSRYWKTVINHSKLRIDKNNNSSSDDTPYFLNQLIYRLNKINNEKYRKIFVINFFKTLFFQNNFKNIKLNTYNIHQILFLYSKYPESIIYSINNFKNALKKESIIVNDIVINLFKKSLMKSFHDEQIYIYYLIKTLDLQNDLLSDNLIKQIKNSGNQVLLSLILKDNLLLKDDISSLLIKDESMWLQNYEVLLYKYNNNLISEERLKDLIIKYLVPESLRKNQTTYEELANNQKHYFNFYLDNILSNNSIINNNKNISQSIEKYLHIKNITISK